MSIPHTYLIDISSGENVAAVIFIAHLLVFCSLHPWSCSSMRGCEKPDRSGRASARVRIGNRVRHEKQPGCCNKPHRPAETLMDGESSLPGGHCSGI
jgi:hypothetical protein